MAFVSIIQKIRPAPLQVLLLNLFGLNKRKVIQVYAGRFYVDPTSNFGSSLAAGQYEPDLVMLIQKYLVSGSTFLDLGANEVFFTVIASKISGPCQGGLSQSNRRAGLVR